MSTVALRTALIWHDEVMSDVVVEKPTKITLGATGKATFVVPDVGLPAEFAIVRPGNRGYLLTLGEHMRGTICVDGKERDVEELVRKEAAGGFCAMPISGRDWGVIDLDSSGDHKLFFQFVPLEEPPQFFTPKVIMAGLGGYLLAALLLTVMWLVQGHAISEAAFRGVGIATLALSAGAVGWWIWIQDGDSKTALAFSIILHAALLYTTFTLYEDEDPFEWPGPRALTGQYLVTRLEPAPEPEPIKATVTQVNQEAAAAASKTKPKRPTATKNPEGASGGIGDTERARHENARDDDKPAPPRVALLDSSNEKEIQNIVDRAMAVDVGKFMGIPGETKAGSLGFGKGEGTGVGDRLGGTGTTRGSKGRGKGGGGNVEGDFESKRGKISTGKDRPGGDCRGPNCTGAAPKEVKVTIADPTGDFGGYTEDEINRVVKARAGIFRACYQRELNRSPGIGGKLVIRFKIGATGKVVSAAKTGGSSLANAAVESCVKSNVMRLKFPPKGAIANVTYPFVFTQGG